MVSVNYQTFGTKGFQLRLRLYQDGETRYINVTKMLKGAILKRHWSAKKQCFIPSCPFADENNEAINRFRRKYDERAITWKGSLYGFIASFEEKDDEVGIKMLQELIAYVVSEKKKRYHKDGTIKGTFEGYEKLDRRLAEYCKYAKLKYEKIMVKDVNPAFINGVFDWIAETKDGKGYGYVSAMFHAVMMEANDLGLLPFESLKGTRWKEKTRESENKYRTLTNTQCKILASMDVKELPKGPKSELYRDFCVFLLYTGQSPCDAIALKYEDIKTIRGVEHFIFKRRKIAERQPVPCAVPINKEMKRIMKRWEKEAKDGYVFPIRNDHKLNTQRTNNGDIKHFIGRLNTWLKKIGEILGCDFPLHTYTFRHTSITNYISKGVPVVYVANLVGTSVKNCEQIYYNNQGDIKSRNLVMDVFY